MMLENICNETTACICCKCRCKDPFERNFDGTAGDIVHFGVLDNRLLMSDKEYKEMLKKKSIDLKMNPPINFNDKRKKKEWEK